MLTSEESVSRLITHGEYERAIADLTQLAESTRDPSWYCKRSEVYFKIGDLQKAYQDANRALEQQPSAEACFWKGCALMKLEEFEKASECFTQGKKLLGSNDKEILDKLQQGNICSALLRNASRSLGSFAEFESEFECTLCLQLFYNPSTLPCGHTFCQHCLETATTFTNKCPLCRTIFHFHDSKPPVTITLKNIIEKLFKEEYAARATQIAQKTRRTFRIPLLVMNVVCFPGEQLPLHIYETKYRTMFKRILQGCRHFGLVLDAPNNGIAHIGCSLVIEQCEGLPDGRLIVQCTALKRFRIISREMIDGYWYAEIEYLQDVLPLTEDALAEMHALIDTVRDMAAKASTKNNLAPEHAEQLQQIVSYNTSIPTNTPEECNRFSYWVCAMLPIASSLKQPLLEMDSGTERLFRVISLLDRVSRTPAGCGLL